MKTYMYQALNIKGDNVDGNIQAENELKAILTLRGRGLYPTGIKEITSSPVSADRPKHPDRTYVREQFTEGFVRGFRKTFSKSLIIGILIGITIGVLIRMGWLGW